MKFEVEINNSDVLDYISGLAEWHKVTQSEIINLLLEDMLTVSEFKIISRDVFDYIEEKE